MLNAVHYCCIWLPGLIAAAVPAALPRVHRLGLRFCVAHVVFGSGSSATVLHHRWLLQYITEHFSSDVEAMRAGSYDSWQQQPLSAVAGIILADQFTRYARATAVVIALAWHSKPSVA
jgi:hypothetical protein